MATTPFPQTSPILRDLIALGVVRVSADGSTLLLPSGAAYTLAGNQVAPATTATFGTVKQAALQANAAGANPTKTEFDALLQKLKDAGLMASA